ncbi:hypothetical protein EDC94DRAFT_153832 [Helicostylum pulchrum]|nr:hypothetical protein EDC94DRAFT_153832 [Helicostylum pulchrum]
MEGLHCISKKGKDNWDENDKLLMQEILSFLSLEVKNSIADSKNSLTSLEALHYAFIVPYQWTETMREEILRPMFIQSGLITSEDHQDRLLFFTDIESICYNLQKSSTTRNPFKRGQNSVFCRFSCHNENEILIKLNLIQTTNNLSNFSGSMLFPRVMNSDSLSISADYIKASLKSLLTEKLFPIQQQDTNRKRYSIRTFLKDGLFPVYEDHIIIETMVEDIYSGSLPDMDICNKDNPQNEHWICTKKRWMLSKDQNAAIKSIYPIDIYDKIGKPFFDAMKNILLGNFIREYVLFPFEDEYSTGIKLDTCLLKWVSCIMEHNRRSLNSITKMTRIDISFIYALCLGNITSGAGFGVLEATKSSNINSKPRILNTDISDLSSSVFSNYSKANAIINIDISLKSTILSLSLLNDDGLAEEIFDHSHFTGEKYLPSLETFYQVSHVTALIVKEQFISFADAYLVNDINNLADDEDIHDCIYDIEEILGKCISANEVLVSTEQKVYIKAFLLMYMTYIKEIISSKLLSDHLNCDAMNIGYAISIEKFLLDGVVGTINDLEKIVYKSGLVPKDDSSKKSRIVTQHGDGILPAIQKYFNLELPLKSYFILAQLHEGHMHLTLNQTVTCPDLKGEQESIIVEDKMVPIENIYDSMCLNVWNNLIENNDLIQLCDQHSMCDTNGVWDLFSSKNKKEFEINLKRYISGNIPTYNKDLPTCGKKTTLQLSKSCHCKFFLSTDDIIDISFKPVLQETIFNISTSLLNKDMFGNYENIHYLFSLICFDYNPQFQRSITTILQEESDDFNHKHGIYTQYLTIPELSNLNLHPVLEQQPYMYRSFHQGTFRQVSSENYAFVIGSTSSPEEPRSPLFKNKITDTLEFEYGYKNIFPFLKMGDVVSDIQSGRTLYLKPRNYKDKRYIPIELFKYKTLDNLEYNGTATSVNDVIEPVEETYPLFMYDDFKWSGYIPVMISVRSQGHSSSLLFSVSVIGEDMISKRKYIETGEPLTLSRF